MPQETKSQPAPDTPGLQGLVATRDDEQALLHALEQAFDYRGDVTLTLTSGDQLTGYIFDRTNTGELRTSTLRLLTPDDDHKRSVSYADVDRVEFTGKDTAHGKSFERYLEKFIQRATARLQDPNH